MLGIMNEGSGKHVTMLSSEGAKHDCNRIVSQLHYYLTNVEPVYGITKEIGFHLDSCSGQKNNIFLGYWMLRVLLGHNDKIESKFITVDHTKFGPDRVLVTFETR